MNAPLRIIAGPIADESDLVNALRARVDEVNVSRAEIDAELELPGGYTSKRLTLPQVKYFGPTAFWNIAELLGLAVILVEDPHATKRYAARMKRRSRPQAVTGTDHWRGKRVETLLRQRICENASKGGFARASALSPERATCLARKATKTRWQKHRQAAKKTAQLLRLNPNDPEKESKMLKFAGNDNWTVKLLRAIKPGDRLVYYRGDLRKDISNAGGAAYRNILCEIESTAHDMARTGRVDLTTEVEMVSGVGNKPQPITRYIAIGR